MMKEEIALVSKKHVISFLLTALLLTSIPVPAGAAAQPGLVLDASVKAAGDTVKLSGTSSYNEVVIKVVRPDGTVLYINVVHVTQGSFADAFTLPADAIVGEYTVVTGQGRDAELSSRSFTVKKKADGGDNGNTGHVGGSGGGQSQIGGSKPNPDAGLPAVKVTDTSISTEIPASALTMSKEMENGLAYAKVAVDQAALLKAFQALQAHSDAQEKAEIIEISVPREGNGSKVELPAAALKEGQSALPQAMLSIQSGASVLELPLQSLAVSQLEKSMHAQASMIKLVVAMQSKPDLLLEKERKAMTQRGMTLWNDPSSFVVTAVANGGQAAVDIGSKPVRQNMSFASKIDPRTSTVVAIDPKTQELRFVPAQFQPAADGGGTTVIFQGYASMEYMVISSRPTFGDTAGHWAQPSIEHLAAKQIVQGTSLHAFDPNGQVTRAEFTAILVRALSLPSTDQPASTAFRDVQVGDWFAGAVHTASQTGLIDGMPDGTFQPKALVTREQMAVMIERAMVHLDHKPTNGRIELTSRYKDAGQIGEWAKESMALLVAEKVMEGVRSDQLAPKMAATRAEAVTLMERVMQFAKLLED
ncbi:S-layer homology domain-containing protein [Paenibacillus guangzhouensis]|uniref:S-layer homology domain-containing protein n=1 Tax=Paenibacillus guangzhouensis TaxID=1473112 RepID=UPI001266D69D|nr:S-layer homology domain-containing protein [Paenibacillus guangzhouensis]